MRSQLLRRALVLGLGVLAVGAAGFGIWVLRLPPLPQTGAPPSIPADEVEAM